MSEQCRFGRMPSKAVRRTLGLASATALLATGCVAVSPETPPPKPECKDGLRNAYDFIVDRATLHSLIADQPDAWQEMNERITARLSDSKAPHPKVFSVETTVLYPGQTDPSIVAVDLQQKETTAYKQAVTLGHLAATNLHYYVGSAEALPGGDNTHKATIRLEEYCQVAWPSPTEPPRAV